MCITTVKDFELFVKECKKWLTKFQLNNWYVKFEHKELDKGQAHCQANYKAMNACISLTTQCEDKLTLHDIQELAFHECCELLLAKLSILSSSRYIMEEELVMETHTVIHKLQDILCK